MFPGNLLEIIPADLLDTLKLQPCSCTDGGCVCCRVAAATREISERVDNGGREEKATVRKTALKKEGGAD